MAIVLADYSTVTTGGTSTLASATFTLTGTTSTSTMITSYMDSTSGQIWYSIGDKWVPVPSWTTTLTPAVHPVVTRPRQRDDPDAAARQARFAAELAERDRARSLAVATARATARALLEDWLTPAQLATLARGFIDVTGSAGGRYRIRTDGGQSGNVDLLDGAGQTLLSYCAHPRGHVPHEDGFLAQLLHLETDEPGFVQVANIDRDYRPRLLAARLQAAA